MPVFGKFLPLIKLLANYHNLIYEMYIKNTGGSLMKRTNVLPVCFNDPEMSHLDELVRSYRASGSSVSKAALIRYGLTLIPLQPSLPFLPDSVPNKAPLFLG